jgi:hypothetical protein
VASKHELKERIMAGINDVNRHPTPRLPDMIRTMETLT